MAEAVMQLLMETDVDGLIAADDMSDRASARPIATAFRDRTLDMRLGSSELHFPTLRHGSYFPLFLERGRASEKAWMAVIQEAWIGGVSTRRVDDLVQAMGLAETTRAR